VFTSHGVKGALEFVGVLDLQRLKVYAQRRRCSFYNAPIGMQKCTGWIPKDSQAGCLGNSLDEQLRLFGGYVGACIEGYPGDVSSGVREALNETLAYRIACICKHDRDRCGGIFSRLGRRRSSRDYYIDLETDQFRSRILQSVSVAPSKPAFNEDILSLNPT